jgi:hypothetical protein
MSSKPKQNAKQSGGKKAAALWRSKERVGVPRYSKSFQEFLKNGGRSNGS